MAAYRRLSAVPGPVWTIRRTCAVCSKAPASSNSASCRRRDRPELSAARDAAVLRRTWSRRAPRPPRTTSTSGSRSRTCRSGRKLTNTIVGQFGDKYYVLASNRPDEALLHGQRRPRVEARKLPCHLGRSRTPGHRLQSRLARRRPVLQHHQQEHAAGPWPSSSMTRRSRRPTFTRRFAPNGIITGHLHRDPGQRHGRQAQRRLAARPLDRTADLRAGHRPVHRRR